MIFISYLFCCSHAHKSKSSDAALTDLLQFLHALFLDGSTPLPKEIRGLKALTAPLLLEVLQSLSKSVTVFQRLQPKTYKDFKIISHS